MVKLDGRMPCRAFLPRQVDLNLLRESAARRSDAGDGAEFKSCFPIAKPARCALGNLYGMDVYVSPPAGTTRLPSTPAAHGGDGLLPGLRAARETEVVPDDGCSPVVRAEVAIGIGPVLLFIFTVSFTAFDDPPFGSRFKPPGPLRRTPTCGVNGRFIGPIARHQSRRALHEPRFTNPN